MSIPRWTVPRRRPWEEIPSANLTLADGSGAPEQATTVRLCWDDEALHVRFDCEDRDAWGTFRHRDDPLWQEEVVEVFLAPGEEDPVRYMEIEVSPLGVLFDARIHNPTGLRANMTADVSWDCPGIRWEVGRGPERQDWWVELSIPWRGRRESGGRTSSGWSARGTAIPNSPAGRRRSRALPTSTSRRGSGCWNWTSPDT